MLVAGIRVVACIYLQWSVPEVSRTRNGWASVSERNTSTQRRVQPSARGGRKEDKLVTFGEQRIFLLPVIRMDRNGNPV